METPLTEHCRDAGIHQLIHFHAETNKRIFSLHFG